MPNIGRFIGQLESAYEKGYSAKQGEEIYDRLQGFQDEQLNLIYKWLTLNVTKKPLLADIFNAARELGFLAKQPRDTTQSPLTDFEPTDCRLCGGQGLLQVIFSQWRDGEGKPYRRLEKVAAHNERIDYEIPEGERHDSYLYRCSCEAGERDGLPTKWPRWKVDHYDTAGASDKRKAAGDVDGGPQSVGTLIDKMDIITDDDIPF